MDRLNVIKHPDFGIIRTEVVKGEVYFCGKDICDALGYKNQRYALKLHCRTGGVVKYDTPTESGVQRMTFINEANLYRLILKSNLPAADKFESWVCDEVLPLIRRTGFYGMGMKELKEGPDDASVMRMLTVIDSFLVQGDKKRIAEATGISAQSINNVIKGYSRSPRILAALFDRALENSRNIRGNLYLSPERTIERLLNPTKK
jgi:prophage antirepressor-like protein